MFQAGECPLTLANVRDRCLCYIQLLKTESGIMDQR